MVGKKQLILWRSFHLVAFSSLRNTRSGSSLDFPEQEQMCAKTAQLVRSLTANQDVLGSIPGLVEG